MALGRSVQRACVGRACVTRAARAPCRSRARARRRAGAGLSTCGRTAGGQTSGQTVRAEGRTRAGTPMQGSAGEEIHAVGRVAAPLRARRGLLRPRPQLEAARRLRRATPPCGVMRSRRRSCPVLWRVPCARQRAGGERVAPLRRCCKDIRPGSLCLFARTMWRAAGRARPALQVTNAGKQRAHVQAYCIRLSTFIDKNKLHIRSNSTWCNVRKEARPPQAAHAPSSRASPSCTSLQSEHASGRRL